MAQTQNNQASHLGDDSTFPSHSSPNSNPFTADLKGEFTSNFGTNTNAAVSQIFKDGGFGQESRTKYFLLGGLVLVLLAVGFVYVLPMLTSDSDPMMMAPPVTQRQPVQQEVAPVAETPAETAATTEEVAASSVPTQAVEQTQVAPEQAVQTSSAPISLQAPNDQAQFNYDETQAPVQFTWNGNGTIVFSRSASMKPAERRVAADGAYTFMHPMPGTWYWNVVSTDGSTSEVRSFIVNPPVRRNIALTTPAEGDTVSGSGGATVTWQGDSQVSYYRVEMIDAQANDWGNPAYRFQTSSQAAEIKDVTPGQYKMRLGAFSQVSGRFEYTAPRNVTIQ